ncbi:MULTISPECIES: hypothetical protein [Mycetohabitans]|nr:MULTISPECIES: hypothetical protein [Mycetohabitans]MCG1047800.1 hypothetical protein [Mycetohabitans sp. B6]
MNIFTGSFGFATLSVRRPTVATAGKQLAPIRLRAVSNYIGELVPQNCWCLKGIAVVHFGVALPRCVRIFYFRFRYSFQLEKFFLYCFDFVFYWRNGDGSFAKLLT